MPEVASKRDLLTVWRRRLFYVWLGAAFMGLAITAIGGPLVTADGMDGTTWIALAAPIPSMIFAVSGMAWLVLLAMTNRSNDEHQPRP